MNLIGHLIHRVENGEHIRPVEEYQRLYSEAATIESRRSAQERDLRLLRGRPGGQTVGLVRSWAASRPATANVLLCVALAAAGALLPSLAARWARPALIEFGPNDVGYTSGFREDWERDGLTRFRWTGMHVDGHPASRRGRRRVAASSASEAPSY